MPLLDIAISQPCSCFHNNTLAFRPKTHFHNKIVIGNDRRLGLESTFSWKSFKLDKNYKSGRVEVWRSALMIRAVATFEITSTTRKNEAINGHENVFMMGIDSVRSNNPVLEPQSPSEDSTKVNSREQLRRMRISKANKGNTPWNKGRKHSPETLRKIKERTRLAMQDPKVKMKLVNLGHAQSEDTRMKIGMGVRLGWEKRREKLMLQETCHYEWQNLIAVSARKGLLGEEEMQWDSYKILDEQLEKEWLQSVEERRKTPRPKGSKRAPKSAEQKRKISAAIAAKWADPEYRGRVCTALAKFHGIPEGVERKPRRKPREDGQIQKSLKKKDGAVNLGKNDTKSQVQRIKLKRSKSPFYKDPLASSKLEMLKNIRAKRAAAVNKQTEAITKARLLIAEAKKAAEALEIAALNSPLAQASLEESRMLIAEAIQFIESIENENPISFESTNSLPELETESDTKEEIDSTEHIKVNGFHSSSATGIFDLSDLIKGDASSSCYRSPLETDEAIQEIESNGSHIPELNNTENFIVNQSYLEQNSNGTEQKLLVNGTQFELLNVEEPVEKAKVVKKWVRGRLVEVEEET